MKKLSQVAITLFISLLGTTLWAAPTVVLETTLGRIVLELDEQQAPVTVNNFLSYVDQGFYDNTVFHRVIDNFMIQGGGFDTDYRQKQTRAPIRNESRNGLRNLRGTIAMARTGQPHSATAQFFINTVDNAALNPRGQNDWGYAVFGKVIEGMDVVDRIGKTRTGQGLLNGQRAPDVPLLPVIINSAQRLADKPEAP